MLRNVIETDRFLSTTWAARKKERLWYLVRTGSNWSRIRTNRGYRNFALQKRRGIFWTTQQLSDLQGLFHEVILFAMSQYSLGKTEEIQQEIPVKRFSSPVGIWDGYHQNRNIEHYRYTNLLGTIWRTDRNWKIQNIAIRCSFSIRWRLSSRAASAGWPSLPFTWRRPFTAGLLRTAASRFHESLGT
jgi:hypothetical protein